jgi:hypothetical protein
MDLLLGSDIGLWAAQTVDPALVDRVVTHEGAIARLASSRGMRVERRIVGGSRALSVHYPHLLDMPTLTAYEGVWNLHPSLLPWGRGHFPLVWSIWLGEPAGATLHRMVAKVDAGPIVAQRRVAVRDGDTADALHRRVRRAERRLFKEWWPRLASGDRIPERAQSGPGSYHDRRAFQHLLGTDPDEMKPADEDRLRRALTFAGKPGLRERG